MLQKEAATARSRMSPMRACASQRPAPGRPDMRAIVLTTGRRGRGRRRGSLARRPARRLLCRASRGQQREQSRPAQLPQSVLALVTARRARVVHPRPAQGAPPAGVGCYLATRASRLGAAGVAYVAGAGTTRLSSPGARGGSAVAKHAGPQAMGGEVSGAKAGMDRRAFVARADGRHSRRPRRDRPRHSAYDVIAAGDRRQPIQPLVAHVRAAPWVGLAHAQYRSARRRHHGRR